MGQAGAAVDDLELCPPTGLAILSRLRVGPDEYAVLSFPIPVAVAPDSLTDAEREVIARMLLGEKPAAIARARGTSRNTVNNQIRSVYGKLGVRSRKIRFCSRLACDPCEYLSGIVDHPAAGQFDLCA